MFPEEENDRRSGSGAKTTRFQVVMHFDSDEEEQTENQDDIQQNQYQLLSQDLNGQDDDEEENDEDGENDGRDRTLRVAWTASFDDFQVQNSHADADAIPSNQSIAIDNHQAKCVEPLFEQHSSENGQQDIQREWNQKDELSEGSKMELNQGNGIMIRTVQYYQ